jgi:hypothetical protein
MEQYQTELAEAVRRLSALGWTRADFDFTMAFVPPEPDGAGMFTVEYAATITHLGTSRSLTETGGIGCGVDRWRLRLIATSLS